MALIESTPEASAESITQPPSAATSKPSSPAAVPTDTALVDARGVPTVSTIPQATAAIPVGGAASATATVPQDPAVTAAGGPAPAIATSPVGNAPRQSDPPPPVAPQKNELNYIGNELDETAPIWRVYRKEITAHDKEITLDEWNKTLDVLLIFSGLFSAVVTTFVVATYPMLKTPDADPIATALYAVALTLDSAKVLQTLQLDSPAKAAQPTRTIRTINALWFCSLFTSLAVAFLSILAKQWLVEYTHRMSSPVQLSRSVGEEEKSTSAAASVASRSWATRRRLFFKGLQDWHISGFVTQILPSLLHVGLFLFLAGLAVLLWSLDHIVAIAFLTLTALLGAFYFSCIILPMIWQECPSIPIVHRHVIMVPITLLELCILVFTGRLFSASRRFIQFLAVDLGCRLFAAPVLIYSVIQKYRRALWRNVFTPVTSDIETGVIPPSETQSLQRITKLLWDRRRGSIPSSDPDPKDDVELLKWLLLDCSTEDSNLIAFQAIGALPPDYDLEDLRTALEGITGVSLLSNLQSTTITATDAVRVLRSEMRLRQQLPRERDLSPAMLEALRNSGFPDAQLLFAALGGSRDGLRAHISNWEYSSSVESTASLIQYSVPTSFIVRAYYCEFILDKSKRLPSQPFIRRYIWRDALESVDILLRARILISLQGWSKAWNTLSTALDLYELDDDMIEFMACEIWLDHKVLPDVDIGAIADSICRSFSASADGSKFIGPATNILRMYLAATGPRLYLYDWSMILLRSVLQNELKDLDLTSGDCIEMVYCVAFLTCSTKAIMDLLPGTKQCFLVNKLGHGEECGIQCIPSFIVRLLDNPGSVLRTVAICAILRWLSKVPSCFGSSSGSESAAFWLPAEDPLIIEFLSHATWAEACQHIRRDNDHWPTVIEDVLPADIYQYCRALNNLPYDIGLQASITERLSDTLSGLVESSSSRSPQDWRKIQDALIRYFIWAVENISTTIFTTREHSTACLHLAKAILAALNQMSSHGEDISELERTFRDGINMFRSYALGLEDEWPKLDELLSMDPDTGADSHDTQ